MTAKQFFKSTAFKCVVTLFCVLLVCGIFLTVMYGFMEVTEQEKFNRKVGKLYSDGSQITTEEKEIESVKIGSSTIEKLWLIPEKHDYLVQTSGTGRDGKIVTWVIVEMDSSLSTVEGIGTVLVYEKVASEYADKISGWNTNISNFSKDYADGVVYKYGTLGDPMYINTGASVSFTAISNCVNDTITFVKAYAGGGVIGKTPFDDFLYTDIINKDETEASFADGKVTYKIKTVAYGGVTAPFTFDVVVGADKRIESFTISVNGSTYGFDEKMPDLANILTGKDASYFTGLYGENMEYTAIAGFDDGSVTTGATTDTIASKSVYVCMYAGAFATANYENAIKLGIKYTEIIDTDNTTWTADGGKVTYKIKTVAYGGVTAPFTLDIVVGADKRIESFTISVNGSTYGFDEKMPDLANILTGKDASYFTGLYGENMEYTAIAGFDGGSVTTGATTDTIASKSVYVCMYAGAFATANYDLTSVTGGDANE